jgi:anti-anti-sigma regulatory factor
MALPLLIGQASRKREGHRMLKITKLEETQSTVVLKLEGKVTDQWAALLEGECRAFLRHRKRLLLDCAAVSFLDARGVEVLRNLPLHEVTLIGAPDFVTELLQTGGRS